MNMNDDNVMSLDAKQFSSLAKDPELQECAKKLWIMTHCQCNFRYLFDPYHYARDQAEDQFNERCYDLITDDDLSDYWGDLELEEQLEILLGKKFRLGNSDRQCHCLASREIGHTE